jgi:hypothetical protein
MATAARDITFVISGQAQPVARAARGSNTSGTVKASVKVGAQRGSGDAVRVTARPGEDVVVLTIAGGPTLVLHPEDARDLLHAQAAGATRSAMTAGDANEVMVSAQLGWPGLEAGATRGATRGWMGQAVLSAVDVVTGLFKDPAADIAAAAVTKKVDGQVDEGVYQLQADALPASLKGSGLKRPSVPPAEDGGPLLVLIHGTFVDTVHTFGKLWTIHPEALPAGARLHLVTHSRGGLVAEVLARACGGGTLGTDELALFDGAQYAAHRTDLQTLVVMARKKGLKVERVVRVACPARGTLLASKRLDAYLSVLQWGLQLAGLTVSSLLVDFLHEVGAGSEKPKERPHTPASCV